MKLPTRTITALAALLLAMPALGAACSGGSPMPDDSMADKPMSDSDTPVSSDDAMEKPTPSPAGGTPCEQEIALECGEGMKDGCLMRVAMTVTDQGEADVESASDYATSYHICAKEQEDNLQGTGCEAEIALECGEGMVDACLLTPAASKVHICVADPR